MPVAEVTVLEERALPPDVVRRTYGAPPTVLLQFQALAPTVKSTGRGFPWYTLVVFQARPPSVSLTVPSINPLTNKVEFRAQLPAVSTIHAVNPPTVGVEFKALPPGTGVFTSPETAWVQFKALPGTGGVETAHVVFRALGIIAVNEAASVRVEFQAIVPDVRLVEAELQTGGGGQITGPPIRVRPDGNPRHVPTTTRRGTMFNA